MDQVYLIYDEEEFRIGTIDEIVNGVEADDSGPGMSFSSILSDIVAEILGSPSDCAFFAIEIR